MRYPCFSSLTFVLIDFDNGRNESVQDSRPVDVAIAAVVPVVSRRGEVPLFQVYQCSSAFLCLLPGTAALNSSSKEMIAHLLH